MGRSKRKTKKGKRDGKALPVKAWEKLKGRGPFPYTVPDAKMRKRLSSNARDAVL